MILCFGLDSRLHGNDIKEYESDNPSILQTTKNLDFYRYKIIIEYLGTAFVG